MNLIFIGTAEFGIPTLEEISKTYSPDLVVTQPDRPAGRGKKIRKPSIKKRAEKLNLEIYQPENINQKSSIKKLKQLSPDILLLVAYGQILGKQVLSLPTIGPVNLHGSLLPEYRGPAPINWAIIEGEKETGVTTIFMDEGVDTGHILLQEEVPINKDDTAGTLHDRLAKVGAKLVIETLNQLESGQLEPEPQDPKTGSYAPKLERKDGEINWGKPSEEIYNQIRGMNPYPGAFTFYGGMRLKIHKSSMHKMKSSENPGQVIDFTNSGITVTTGDGLLELLEIQPEARKKMSGTDFVNGYDLKVGNRFR